MTMFGVTRRHATSVKPGLFNVSMINQRVAKYVKTYD